MANGYFERGEIYAVRMDTGYGSEEGSFRPGVIISCDEGNTSNGTVIVAYLTTKPRKESIYFSTMATGRMSWILTNQVFTVDKNRLKPQMMGVLNASELKQLDEKLEVVFDLGYVDDTALKEKDELLRAQKAVIAEKDSEIQSLKDRMRNLEAAHENELASYKVEVAMWQRLYEKALGTVVDMKFAADWAVRRDRKEVVAVEKPPVAPIAVVVKEPEEPQDVDEQRVDINHCTITELKKLGFSLPMGKKIVDSRPFSCVDDLKRVNGLKSSLFRLKAPLLCCTPIVVAQPEPVVEAEPDPGFEKVNVNTASAKEISEALGISMGPCYAITGKRKQVGKFTSLEEIVVDKRFTEKMLALYRDRLEV